MTHRKLLLGVLAGAAAVAAVPTAANAATCTYDPATRAATVQYAPADSGVTIANNYYLQFKETGGGLRNCSGSPTVGQLAKITVRGATGTGPAQQMTTIDERQGGLTDGNPNLMTYILTGTGGDHLIDLKGGGDDWVRLLGSPGLGPNVDLNYDGHVDVVMTTGNDSVFEFHGGAGADLLDAMSTSLTHVWAYGDSGNDVLVGTKNSNGGDYLDGGADNDYLYSYVNNAGDTVYGGSGVDKATVDYGLDSVSAVETVGYE